MDEQTVIWQLGPLGISRSLLTSWGIVAGIWGLCLLLTRRLRLDPGPLQTLLEGLVSVQERAIAQVAPGVVGDDQVLVPQQLLEQGQGGEVLPGLDATKSPASIRGERASSCPDRWRN